MATSTAQRVGIWVIAVALVFGTIFGFVVMILSTENDTQSQQALQQYQQEYTAYQTEVSNEQAALTANADELSKQYYDTVVAQKSRVKKFDASKITELDTITIKNGDGEAIDDNMAYAAYYIGFLSDGTIFDSSIDGDKLKAPIVVQPGGVIQGWSQGLAGTKIGGIYELSIPSDLAYGEQGSGDKIKPNTPLKFVVFPIKYVASQPAITEEVIDAYGNQ